MVDVKCNNMFVKKLDIDLRAVFVVVEDEFSLVTAGRTHRPLQYSKLRRSGSCRTL